MQYHRLAQTDLKISRICLGTMTWGEQNSEAEAHAQLDYALAQGINFIDTAEMYPVPPRAETQIDSINLKLTTPILERIEIIHRRQPNPCP